MAELQAKLKKLKEQVGFADGDDDCKEESDELSVSTPLSDKTARLIGK